MSSQSLLNMNSCFVQNTNWGIITTKMIIKMEWRLGGEMKAENMTPPCSLLRCFHTNRQCAARRNSFWDSPGCKNSPVKIMTHIKGKYSSRQWTDGMKRNYTEFCNGKHSDMLIQMSLEEKHEWLSWRMENSWIQFWQE